MLALNTRFAVLLRATSDSTVLELSMFEKVRILAKNGSQTACNSSFMQLYACRDSGIEL